MADLYLLPGLKKMCANVIGQTLSDSTVISVLRVSRMFDLTKLEDQCAEYMARNLERVGIYMIGLLPYFFLIPASADTFETGCQLKKATATIIYLFRKDSCHLFG